LGSSQSWLPLLRPSIPIGWHLHLLRELAVFVYAQRKRLRLAFEWKPGLKGVELWARWKVVAAYHHDQVTYRLYSNIKSDQA